MRIIEVRNLSKTYKLDKTLKDASSIKNALSDVSFSMNRGECIGIIGRNGSGKSTLLKIISGISKPTEGTVDLHVRINSILEIGDNFLEDLTGEENLEMYFKLRHLNSKNIKQAIKNAHEFSELGEFFYQPLKSYSMGMKLRLGVAGSLQNDAELFIIDEVFSAGDANFRAKVTAAFKAKIKKRLSLLLVSHSPEEILDFCETCIWMENGRIVKIGPAKEVIDEYYYTLAKEKSEKDYALSNTLIEEKVFNIRPFSPHENEIVKIDNFSISSLDGNSLLTFDEPIVFNVGFTKKEANLTLHAQIIIYDYQMRPVLMLTQHHNSEADHKTKELIDYTGKCSYKVMLPANMITFGNFFAELGLGKNIDAQKIHNENAIQLPMKIHFKVEIGKTRDWTGGNEQVFVKPACVWEITTA